MKNDFIVLLKITLIIKFLLKRKEKLKIKNFRIPIFLIFIY